MARHPFDLFSFVAGLLFTGLAAAYVVGAYADVRLDPRYLLPLGLVVLGGAGIAASVLAQRRSTRAAADASDPALSSDADTGD